jgi:hypothetical protein
VEVISRDCAGQANDSVCIHEQNNKPFHSINAIKRVDNKDDR